MLKMLIGILEMVFKWRQKFFRSLFIQQMAQHNTCNADTRYVETVIATINDIDTICHVLVDPVFLQKKGLPIHGISVALCEAYPESHIYIIRISETVARLSVQYRRVLYAHEIAHIFYKHTYSPVYHIDTLLRYDLVEFYLWLWSLLTSDVASPYLTQEIAADKEAIRVTSRWCMMTLLVRGSFCRDIATKILTLRRMWYAMWYTSSEKSYSWSVSICILKTSIE